MKHHEKLFLLAIPFMLSSCAYDHMNDHAIICNNMDAKRFYQTVPSANPGELKKITFRLSPEIKNLDEPISSEIFWVRLTGFNEDRKALMRGRWENGLEGIPMFYSTRHAFIEKEDGSRIFAEPEIYISSDSDPDKPGEALKDSVVDINSDELQFNNKHNWRLYASVYIKFDTPPPLPGDNWKLNFGEIEIGNELFDIPTHSLCLYEGYSNLRWGGFLP